MSTRRLALGLLSAGAAIGAYKVARAAAQDDSPGVAITAAVVSAVAGSAAAHALAKEYGELRGLSRVERRFLEHKGS